MEFVILLIGFLGFGFLGLGFFGANRFFWVIFLAILMWFIGMPLQYVGVFGGMLALLCIPQIRTMTVSRIILDTLSSLKLTPEISETERVALEAGATWVDSELFSGKPDIKKLMNEPYNKISQEEKKFIDGPVQQLCNMTTDWEIQKNGDLPKEVWDYIKKEKFFGMIIPKEYGGLGFSAVGHSEVIATLAIRSIPLCVSVMVPNSLGPAELLIHYGTKEQKDHYLPRLASGEEIPCFALTEPNAGSDAGSIQSSAEVFKGEDGKLYLKLNWDKRYITLAAISTVLGMAVKLRDPNNFLGKGEDLGITCVLVPSNTQGVVLGQRHNPLGTPFYNCPTKGVDVVISIDQIIGGQEMAGKGWQMLMECLGAGRGVTLPSQCVGGTKMLTSLVSAYATVRRQFGVPIGKFEGIEEPLSRIVASSYYLEAMRLYTCGAVDSGIKPSVVSAIAKFMQTEQARKNINDAMDIVGGAGICRGPRNFLGSFYTAMPISITVEGANILTRTMIIFGQGAIRCHPFAYREVKAIASKNYQDFDAAFWGHISHVVTNLCRSILLSFSRGRLAAVPVGPSKKYYRKLSWASASFAIMADIALGMFGGQLKMKEKLTGRFADILCWMYVASATLRRYEAESYPEEHKDVFEYSMQLCFANIQRAFDGIFNNFDVPIVRQFMSVIIGNWSRFNCMSADPSDELGQKIAFAIQEPGKLRDSLTAGMFVPSSENDPMVTLLKAFSASHEAQEIFAKIRTASKAKKLPKKRPPELVEEALAKGVISQNEADLLIKANELRDEAIKVDSFDVNDFKTHLMEV